MRDTRSRHNAIYGGWWIFWRNFICRPAPPAPVTLPAPGIPWLRVRGGRAGVDHITHIALAIWAGRLPAAINVSSPSPFLILIFSRVARRRVRHREGPARGYRLRIPLVPMCLSQGARYSPVA